MAKTKKSQEQKKWRPTVIPSTHPGCKALLQSLGLYRQGVKVFDAGVMGWAIPEGRLAHYYRVSQEPQEGAALVDGWFIRDKGVV